MDRAMPETFSASFIDPQVGSTTIRMRSTALQVPRAKCSIPPFISMSMISSSSRSSWEKN